MSETEHTPTPWDWHFLAAHKDVDAQQSETMTALLANVILFSLESENAAVIRLSPDINSQLTFANMDFIVRACNAHDELVAALRRLLEVAEPWKCGCELYEDGELCPPCAARAVLAKLEKEGT